MVTTSVECTGFPTHIVTRGTYATACAAYEIARRAGLVATMSVRRTRRALLSDLVRVSEAEVNILRAMSLQPGTGMPKAVS